jgi:hypothetical protein
MIFFDLGLTKCCRPNDQSDHAHEKCDTESASLVSGPRRVIDCQSLNVMPWMSGNQYICLRYVWGKGALQDESVECLTPSEQLWGKKLPRNIQDTFEVVKRLGQKYRWIDRYCIDHKNLKEVHDEIQHMDDVYEGAVVTLVAMGPDANYRLPRISRHSQSKQLSARCHFGTLRSRNHSGAP